MMVGETHAADFVVVCPCARADASCRRTGDRFNEFSFQSVKHIQISILSRMCLFSLDADSIKKDMCSYLANSSL